MNKKIIREAIRLVLHLHEPPARAGVPAEERGETMSELPLFAAADDQPVRLRRALGGHRYFRTPDVLRVCILRLEESLKIYRTRSS
jgi:hypothetical protein